MFVDEAEVFLRAGNGGDGSAGFRREKFIPFGGPDGGDGGKGGNIWAIGDENLSDLEKYRFTPNLQAGNGARGMGRQKTGESGADAFLRLPLGTMIFNPENGAMIAEILEHGEKIMLLKGGKGGLGNLHFKSSTNRAPRQFTKGEDGNYGTFKLELKSIADAGMVGFPNAGKSSLVSILTPAHPRVASYPFTTLYVNIGTLEFPKTHEKMTLADIPGLIKGASKNKGLGHKFLRHIERCGVLLIMLDMAGTDGRKPYNDYKDLLDELKFYSEDLLKKKIIVVANKMDEDLSIKNLTAFKKKYPKVKVIPISCLSEEGIETLKKTIYKTVKKLNEAKS